MSDLILSAGHVVGSSGAFVGGGGAVSRASTGVYDLTLSTGVNVTQCVCDVTPIGSPGAQVAVEHVSDTHKRIRTFNATGTAADKDFTFRLMVGTWAPPAPAVPLVATAVLMTDGTVVPIGAFMRGDLLERSPSGTDEVTGTAAPTPAPPTSGDFDGDILTFSDITANQMLTRHPTLARLVGVDQPPAVPFRGDFDGDILTFSDITANQLLSRHPTLARLVGVDPPAAGLTGQLAMVNKAGALLKRGMICSTKGSVLGQVQKLNFDSNRNALGVVFADTADNAAGFLVTEGNAYVYIGSLDLPNVGDTLWLSTQQGTATAQAIGPNSPHQQEIGIVLDTSGYSDPGNPVVLCRLRLTAARRPSLQFNSGTFTGRNGAGLCPVTTNAYPVPVGAFLVGSLCLTDMTWSLPNFSFSGTVATADNVTQNDAADLSGKSYVGFFWTYDNQATFT